MLRSRRSTGRSDTASAPRCETVEYLDLDTRGVHVAEYLTELPPREVLEDRLHRAIEAARNRLALEAGVDINLAPVASTATSDSKTKRKGRRK
jgi:hypothetical protein